MEGSGRKYRKLEDGSRKLCPFPWNNNYFNSYDVSFTVGSHRIEIPAHKAIVSERSKVFKAMIKEHVRPGETLIRIEIGPETNPLAFVKLIQFIYRNNARECLDTLEITDLLDLRILAQIHGFFPLWEATRKEIISQMVQDYTDCYCVLKKSMNTDLRNAALIVLKCNLSEALRSEDSITKWTYEIWTYVLSGAGLKHSEKTEATLIQNLFRWRDHNSFAREEDFHKLLKLTTLV